MEQETRNLTLGPHGGRFHNEVEKELETATQQQETSHGTWDYCVAIRTLGTAGEKYQILLNSLVAQTLSPKKILVYIPHGYPAPKETVGVEQIVRCEKGMVAQRSLPFGEVDTEYILCLDDDLYLPPTLVEELFDALEEKQGDCVSPGFSGSKKRKMDRIISFIHSFTLPHFSEKWDVMVNRSGSFSYRVRKGDKVLPTQSAAFACFLCKMNAFRSIHFEDERWLDQFRYASCDDQLFYYKLHLYGYKVFTYNQSGLIHLDARAGGRHDVSDKLYNQKKIAFVIWYRTRYHLLSNSFFDKLHSLFAYGTRFLSGLLFLPLEVIYFRKLRYLKDYFKAHIDGIKYVHSDEYLSIPPYDNYKK